MTRMLIHPAEMAPPKKGLRKALIELLVTTLTLMSSASLAEPLTFVTGAVPFDQNGKHVQLRGAGILKVKDQWFLWSEDKRDGQTFRAVACYRSPDLVNWTYVGDALGRSEHADLGAERVVERPKVLQHPRTGRFVMYVHIDNRTYTDARVGVATADTPCGPYRYLGGVRPLGNESRDIGLFQEDDGAAYLLSEDRKFGTRIYRLSDDYLRPIAPIALLADHTPGKASPGPGYESPALIKKEEIYYLLGSDLTGWGTNDNKYAAASSLAGPWSGWSKFARPGTRTYNSQVGFVLPVRGSAGTAYLYVGDRWLEDDLYHSPPILLPLTVGSGKVALDWRPVWTLDPRKGLMGDARPLRTIEAEAALEGRRASELACIECSGGKAISLDSPSAEPLRLGQVVADETRTHAFILAYLSPYDGNARLSLTVGRTTRRLSLPPTRPSEAAVAFAVVHVPLKRGEVYPVSLTVERGSGVLALDALLTD